MNDPNGVWRMFMNERISAESILLQLGTIVFPRHIGLKDADLRFRTHGIFDSQFTEIEYVLNKEQTPKRHNTAGLRLAQQDAQFIFAMSFRPFIVLQSNRL